MISGRVTRIRLQLSDRCTAALSAVCGQFSSLFRHFVRRSTTRRRRSQRWHPLRT